MSESNLKKTCAHAELDLDCTATLMEGTTVFMVAVAARCKSCKRRFAFLGDVTDEPSLEAPSRTADHRMMLMPMMAEAAPALIIPGAN